MWGKYIPHFGVITCEINLYFSMHEFTTKLRNWHEMAKLPESFLKQINKMERSFSITSNVFMRYNDIFEQLFTPSPNEKKNCKFR